MWDHMDFGWGMLGGFHVLGWLLVAVVVVVIAWAAANARSGGGRGAGSRALAILEERYARGEIGKDEFEAMKRDLSG